MTHYEVLGIDPSATTAEVRDAYLALARQHHPDREGGDGARMRAVNAAWAALGDPGRRARYDLTLGAASMAIRPEPASAPHEDLLADLADEEPIGGRVVLPRWLSLLPVAVFASSVVVGGGGVLFGSGPTIALAATLFVVSCAMFLAAPFVALLSSRRPNP